MTSVSSFGGDPAGFFDATHMTTENQRKMIDAVLAAGRRPAAVVQLPRPRFSRAGAAEVRRR